MSGWLFACCYLVGIDVMDSGSLEVLYYIYARHFEDYIRVWALWENLTVMMGFAEGGIGPCFLVLS